MSAYVRASIEVRIHAVVQHARRCRPSIAETMSGPLDLGCGCGTGALACPGCGIVLLISSPDDLSKVCRAARSCHPGAVAA